MPDQPTSIMRAYQRRTFWGRKRWWYDCSTCRIANGPFGDQDAAISDIGEHAKRQHTPAPDRRETGAAGVGMPATLHLNAFGREIEAAFGRLPYLVGSAARSKQWRDVDVRLMLPDEEFDELFPGHIKPDRVNAKWALICAAISELGRLRTGLPIDFQIQRMSDANDRYDGIRQALGLHLGWTA